MSYKNVTQRSLEEFFKKLPLGLKMNLHKHDKTSVIYKHDYLSITMTIYPTKMTVLFQGDPLTAQQFKGVSEQTLAEYAAVSRKESPIEDSTNKDDINIPKTDCKPTKKRRKCTNESLQLRNLRFNDFRDDLISFICNWTPRNYPSQTMLDQPSINEVCDQSAQTEELTDE